jgi:hypothetical protein
MQTEIGNIEYNPTKDIGKAEYNLLPFTGQIAKT